MSKRFESGTKQEVLRAMASYAIRDQQALIDAHTPSFGEPDEYTKSVIEGCKAEIRDFRRILKSLAPKDTTKPTNR